jgi:hypothetical protein
VRAFLEEAGGDAVVNPHAGVIADGLFVARIMRAADALEQQRDHRPQSPSASRFTAAQAGFFILSQSGERPER